MFGFISARTKKVQKGDRNPHYSTSGEVGRFVPVEPDPRMLFYFLRTPEVLPGAGLPPSDMKRVNTRAMYYLPCQTYKNFSTHALREEALLDELSGRSIEIKKLQKQSLSLNAVEANRASDTLKNIVDDIFAARESKC